MDRDHTLHAVFAIINYALTITTTSGGTTNPSPGTYIYASGSLVEALAIPDVNYKFVRWELDSTNITANPITILMNKSYTLHAVFQLLTYRLTILSSTGGTTDPEPGTYTYTNGTYASATAIPAVHYLLDYWLLDGNPVGSANPISVLMTDDHTLQPIFVLCNYTLTITTTTGGTTNPVPDTYTYNAGSLVSVTAIPGSGYIFDHWELNGSNAGSANPYTVHMDSNYILKACFASAPAPLTVSISPMSASILVGQQLTFTSTVSGGYPPYAYQWYLNGNPVSGATSNTWTFTPTTSGIFYVNLKVTDAKGNTAQSEAARIVISTVPVGGYSIPIQLPATAKPATLYIASLTILTALFITIKQKTRRKHRQ
jgi:hypothetical protein